MIFSPVVIAGDLWTVVLEPADGDGLIDRTGSHRLATADASARKIRISADLPPELIDRVVLHEIAHAITMSHGLLDELRSYLPEDLWIPVEEWAARLVENHGMEAVELASRVLGRPVCIRGLCR